MFLALTEIRHSKMRYALIILTITLIGYLTFILTSLAYGLAQSNRSAVDSWRASSIVLNTEADGGLRQSSLTKEQVDDVSPAGADVASIGELSAVGTSAGDSDKTTVDLLGIDKDQFVYRELNPTEGRRFDTAHETVADDGLKANGYALGDTIKVGDDTTLTIVGFVHNTKLNVAPVLYVPLETWQTRKFGDLPQGATKPQASAVIERTATPPQTPSGTERLGIAIFIEKLPGYSAQNITFSLMIGFLFVITLVIIAIFQYILTMQKIPNYMVLKIQGIPTWFLVKAMLIQATLIAIVGVVLAAGLAAATALAIPPSVPMSFNMPLLTGAGLAIIVMSTLGSLASVKTIATIRPTSIVAGE
ncbi:MAG: ABC transporter permease [Bifidobacterium mongoliense]